MSVWKNNPDLMQRLTKAQNHEANIYRDVMTFAGMCDTREELENHVINCESVVANYVPPKRRRK